MPVWVYWVGGTTLFLLLVVLYDVTQQQRSILRNFPIIGHLRYWLIEVGPELRQYIVAQNREEAPFNRLERDWIYHSADRENNYFGFGTDDQVYGIGYPIIKHAAFPHPKAALTGNVKGQKAAIPCAKVIGKARERKRPYRPASIFNISAMSFGALGSHAISALNMGARMADCFHNTGEGGVSRYHKHGADICWQIGTGYFGARTLDGAFDMSRLKKTVEQTPQIRMIEIKLSQGAKPGKGGVLPAGKVSSEIAGARGVPVGKDVISPSSHSAFADTESLVEFIEAVAEQSGLPVGIKAAVGQLNFWHELAETMGSSGRGPDFITIDGKEGGTGAAPLTFADHVALPYKIGFSRVYEIFRNAGLTDDIVWIGSGRLGFPDRAIVAIAMGADLVNIAREAMFAIGCIQAQRCHTGLCPSGVATHNAWLQRGLVPEVNAKRFAAFMDAFRGEVLAVTYASGYEHPGEFTPHDIEVSSGPNVFKTLREIFGYDKKQYAPDREPRFKDLTARCRAVPAEGPTASDVHTDLQ
jgi:glutamate synthase (ferredoxin)